MSSNADLPVAGEDETASLLREQEQRDLTVTTGDGDILLRRVPDSIPASTLLITFVETCERFSYFGLSGPFQNYIQNPRGDPLRPGVIGLGQANATRINLGFMMLNYVTPVIGGILADQTWGRYKTLVIASCCYMTGLSILLLSSWVFVDQRFFALAALLVAMLFIGLGSGGIKSNVGPWMAEQYQRRDAPKVLVSGEKVLVDYDMTIQRMFMLFYLCINLGSLSALLTTELEHHYGFAAAFLLPTCVFILGAIILLFCKTLFKIRSPDGSAIVQALSVFRLAARHNWTLEAAKSSYQSTQPRPAPTPWPDTFVDELRRATNAFRIFAFFPFYWLAWSQMLTNFVSQAGTMETHGVPNDILFSLNPLTALLAVPLFDRLLLPALRRLGIPFRPITRISCGFVLIGMAMVYAALVQALIYRAPPCYQFPLQCLDGRVPNQVHVAVQIPAYVMGTLSEVLVASTGMELAFTQAPKSMRSVVMASFLVTTAVGALLGIAITPLTVDPRLVWMYAGLGVMSFVVGGCFWWAFRREEAEV